MVHVTVVHAEACHFCEEAYTMLTELSAAHPIDIDMIASDSDEGRALVKAHRPAMFPLILVDHSYFSAGRLPRKKLLALLARRVSVAQGLARVEA